MADAYSEGPLKKLLARIRPEYVGIDPVDRVAYEPGQLAQCDLWFPALTIPVAGGQARILPVLVIVLGFSRFLPVTMIPSRQAGDILSGMWQLISGIGRVSKTLVWDRESAIDGTGRVSVPNRASSSGRARSEADPRGQSREVRCQRILTYLTRVFEGHVDVVASPVLVEALLEVGLHRAPAPPPGNGTGGAVPNVRSIAACRGAFPLLGAIVTDRGGQLCHAAIVARERDPGRRRHPGGHPDDSRRCPGPGRREHRRGGPAAGMTRNLRCSAEAPS